MEILIQEIQPIFAWHVLHSVGRENNNLVS